ncbi:uncharacterized protein EDB91DRAFT_697974 [Suillus paluster]|uniref:uncharacterized protein n=1 Tax=Suillus paluster TaxID=48578 RepID=UPI001B874645|nr:uncharacterized protein EDB91DRAFT_697974 [Suillus paluster]KAG1750602.1 hypothetical protein EDB91DRAFT_697974 [Suillus paluster]
MVQRHSLPRSITDHKHAHVSAIASRCLDVLARCVSEMVVISREVAWMTKGNKWQDVRLLSFDLQTVGFTHASDYTVLITLHAFTDTPKYNVPLSLCLNLASQITSYGPTPINRLSHTSDMFSPTDYWHPHSSLFRPNSPTYSASSSELLSLYQFQTSRPLSLMP